MEKAAPNLDDATTAAIAAKCGYNLGHAAKAESLRPLGGVHGWQRPGRGVQGCGRLRTQARCRHGDEDYLKLTINNGYSLYFVRDNPDLRSLSNQPQFKSLIAQIGR